MIHRRPFIINPKSTFPQTLKKLLFVHVFKTQLLVKGKQLPYTKFKRKKKWKLGRKHQWMPPVAFFSEWVKEFRWQSAELKNEVYFLLILPVPVSLRIHHALKRIKRDVEVFYDFFNSNDLSVSFMPSRYFGINQAQAHLHTGLNFLRNVKMYTLYSNASWQNEKSFLDLPAVYEPLLSLETAPAVIYYAIDSWIPLNYLETLNSSFDIEIFQSFDSHIFTSLTEIYKTIVLLHIFFVTKPKK